MKNYYVLSIDSLIQTFTVIDSGKRIDFEFSMHENENAFKDIRPGDMILGYLCKPIEEIRYCFQIEDVMEDNKLVLIKRFDIEPGASINELEDVVKDKLNNINEEGKLFKIDENDYLAICKKIFATEQYEDNELNLDYLFDLDNKPFALETVRILEAGNAYSDENISLLLSKEKSSQILKNSFPIFTEVPINATESDLANTANDKSGKRRYYPNIFEINEKKYLITNNWYYKGENGLDTRTPYVEWIKSVLSKENKREENKKDITIIDYFENREVTAPRLPMPFNYLLFGAPGTGKSNTLKDSQKLHFKDENSFERVTFYSSYSYAHFVGTFKPKMEGKDITYKFVPGPFIRILEKAYENPDKNYLLIIEEINRANQAAVFGDVFQLLDREDGKSEYPIETSEELREHLASRLIKGYSDSDDVEFKMKAESQFSKIIIPSNMYIWATMNSADQGVFPMDTAFKRRWDFKYISIDDNVEGIENIEVTVGDSTNAKVIKWNVLRCAINNKLSKICKVNEDKLIGPYFLSKEVIKTTEGTNTIEDNEKFIEAFKSKVLMYLYEDAAKHRKSDMFAGCSDHSRYSLVCSEFEKKGIEIFGTDVKTEVLGRE